MSEIVRLRRFEDVAVVEMNRPERRNALDSSMLKELTGALEELRQDSTVNAVVITGAGGSFSSGADTSEELDPPGANLRMRMFSQLYEVVSDYPKPTVAAIPGPCVGGGAEVASACDLRVGTAKATFRFPGAHLGIPVGIARLPLLVGVSHAKDLLMTSRTVGAEEAFRIGLLNRIADDAELGHESVALAATMAANPGASMQKRLLAEGADLAGRVHRETRAILRWQKESTPNDAGSTGQEARKGAGG
jgi:enoyl-CoA hydratase/carnithine racemase